MKGYQQTSVSSEIFADVAMCNSDGSLSLENHPRQNIPHSSMCFLFVKPWRKLSWNYAWIPETLFSILCPRARVFNSI